MKRSILSFVVGFVLSCLIAASSVRNIESLYELKGERLSVVKERFGEPDEMIPFFQNNKEANDENTLYMEADFGSFVVRLNKNEIVIGVLPKYWVCYPWTGF